MTRGLFSYSTLLIILICSTVVSTFTVQGQQQRTVRTLTPQIMLEQPQQPRTQKATLTRPLAIIGHFASLQLSSPQLVRDLLAAEHAEPTGSSSLNFLNALIVPLSDRDAIHSALDVIATANEPTDSLSSIVSSYYENYAHRTASTSDSDSSPSPLAPPSPSPSSPDVSHIRQRMTVMSPALHDPDPTQTSHQPTSPLGNVLIIPLDENIKPIRRVILSTSNHRISPTSRLISSPMLGHGSVAIVSADATLGQIIHDINSDAATSTQTQTSDDMPSSGGVDVEPSSDDSLIEFDISQVTTDVGAGYGAMADQYQLYNDAQRYRTMYPTNDDVPMEYRYQNPNYTPQQAIDPNPVYGIFGPQPPPAAASPPPASPQHAQQQQQQQQQQRIIQTQPLPPQRQRAQPIPVHHVRTSQ